MNSSRFYSQMVKTRILVESIIQDCCVIFVECFGVQTIFFHCFRSSMPYDAISKPSTKPKSRRPIVASKFSKTFLKMKRYINSLEYTVNEFSRYPQVGNVGIFVQSLDLTEINSKQLRAYVISK